MGLCIRRRAILGGRILIGGIVLHLGDIHLERSLRSKTWLEFK